MYMKMSRLIIVTTVLHLHSIQCVRDMYLLTITKTKLNDVFSVL